MTQKKSFKSETNQQCDVCGGISILTAPNGYFLECPFCGFRKKMFAELTVHNLHINAIDTNAYLKILSLLNLSKIIIKPYDKSMHKEKIIFSINELIYEAEINTFFKNRYKSLNKNGLLYLSLPVSRFYNKSAQHNNQVNFFKSKNIMFLLEQHGFRMVWRKSRFSSQLSLIARKI